MQIYTCEAELQLHSFLGSAPAEVSGPPHAPTALLPGKRPQNPLKRRLGGPQTRCGLLFLTERSLLTPPAFQTLYIAICSLVTTHHTIPQTRERLKAPILRNYYGRHNHGVTYVNHAGRPTWGDWSRFVATIWIMQQVDEQDGGFKLVLNVGVGLHNSVNYCHHTLHGEIWNLRFRGLDQRTYEHTRRTGNANHSEN
jgi:hypothetical protein